MRGNGREKERKKEGKERRNVEREAHSIAARCNLIARTAKSVRSLGADTAERSDVAHLTSVAASGDEHDTAWRGTIGGTLTQNRLALCVRHRRPVVGSAHKPSITQA